jgi:hypothetical protein
MRATNIDAYGLFAAAALEELARLLIGKGVVNKAEMQDLLATVRKALAEKGLRNDCAAETDAAQLASSLSSEIGRHF